MSDPRHTRGPWYVNGCELIGDSTILATLCWHTGRDAENAADAALIAAAPDLLQALKKARGHLTHRPMLDMVDRVIAKADGHDA